MRTRGLAVLFSLLAIVLLSPFASCGRGTAADLGKASVSGADSQEPNIMVINESQTWHGNFVVNQTDTVFIENCVFTVEDGYIRVNGELFFNNSQLIMRRNNPQKFIYVYGNLTCENSNMLGKTSIYIYEGSVEIINSTVYEVESMQFGGGVRSALYITNSSVFWVFDGMDTVLIENSSIEYYDSLNDFWDPGASPPNITIRGSDIGCCCLDSLFESVSLQDLHTGHVELWTFSELDNEILRIEDSIIEGWDVFYDCSVGLISLTITDSQIRAFGAYICNQPTCECNLTLPLVFLDKTSILIDQNLNLTITNSTFSSWELTITAGSFRFTDSQFSAVGGDGWGYVDVRNDVNVSITNSTVDWVMTASHITGNVVLSNVTAGFFSLGIWRGSMDFALSGGYHDSVSFVNETQGYNVTILDSDIEQWGITCHGTSVVNVHDVTCKSVSTSENASASVVNSSVQVASCYKNSSLMISNSTVGTVKCWDNANLTSVNSTFGTLITDPITVTLVGSRILSELLLPYSSEDFSTVFLDQPPLPLPSDVKIVANCLQITTADKYVEAQVRISYDLDELRNLDMEENELRMYCLEEGSSSWIELPVQGVNTTERYVWANVTSFSTFAIGAEAPPAGSACSGGSRKYVW